MLQSNKRVKNNFKGLHKDVHCYFFFFLLSFFLLLFLLLLFSFFFIFFFFFFFVEYTLLLLEFKKESWRKMRRKMWDTVAKSHLHLHEKICTLFGFKPASLKIFTKPFNFSFILKCSSVRIKLPMLSSHIIVHAH